MGWKKVTNRSQVSQEPTRRQSVEQPDIGQSVEQLERRHSVVRDRRLSVEPPHIRQSTEPPDIHVRNSVEPPGTRHSAVEERRNSIVTPNRRQSVVHGNSIDNRPTELIGTRQVRRRNALASVSLLPCVKAALEMVFTLRQERRASQQSNGSNDSQEMT